jgi:hypothetical protein
VSEELGSRDGSPFLVITRKRGALSRTTASPGRVAREGFGGVKFTVHNGYYGFTSQQPRSLITRSPMYWYE